MSRSVVLHSTIEGKKLKELGYRLKELNVSYSRNDMHHDLKLEIEDSSDTVLNILDDTGKWSPSTDDLILEGVIKIGNPDILFGKNGLISKKAEIGIGIMWKSRTSASRGSLVIGNFGYGNDELEFPFRIYFGEASVRGNIELSVNLFVRKNTEKDRGLIPGMTLGELESYLVMLEGLGSSFSVFEKSAPGEPLWNIECIWDEPEYSIFTDSVRIVINTAHPAWALTADDEVRKELLKEIMASAMQVIISEVEPEQYADPDSYEPGSVCDAVAYFVSRAAVNTESAAEVARSVRKYLDKIMK